MDKIQTSAFGARLFVIAALAVAAWALVYKVGVASTDEADRAARDAAIRRDYDGSRQSRERLQLRWDISRAQFYRIINGG